MALQSARELAFGEFFEVGEPGGRGRQGGVGADPLDEGVEDGKGLRVVQRQRPNARKGSGRRRREVLDEAAVEVFNELRVVLLEEPCDAEEGGDGV